MIPSTDAEDLVQSFRPPPAREQKCRSCGAPVDFRPTSTGKVGIYDRGTGVSHFATCPQARQWRGGPAEPKPAQVGLGALTSQVHSSVHTSCSACGEPVILLATTWGTRVVVEVERERWSYHEGEGDPCTVVGPDGVSRGVRRHPEGSVEGRALHPHQPEGA